MWTRRIFLAVATLGTLGVLRSRGIAHARKEYCANKLKMIGLLLKSYISCHGALPPRYVTDENDVPTFGWRTMIAPHCFYNMEVDYFAMLDLSKSWNEESNRKVLERYVSTIQCPSRSVPDSKITQYVAISGVPGPWPSPMTAEEFSLLEPPENEGGLLPIQLDGKRQILIVEWPDSDVVWNEPRDLHVDEFLSWFGPNPTVKAPHPNSSINYLGTDFETYSLSLRTDHAEAQRLVGK